MLKQITLLRHAKSSWSDAGRADIERPLNERGERDAPLIGRWLLEKGERPSLILNSPATRARQTARLVADQLGYPREFMQTEADLYLAAPAEILAVIARQEASFNHLLLCGHNPGITELSNTLSNSNIDNVPTCGVVCIEANVKSWAELSTARGMLKLFQSPKALARGEVLFSAEK